MDVEVLVPRTPKGRGLVRDVIDILKDQHRDVELRLAKLLATPRHNAVSRTNRFKRLASRLERRMADEERLLYTLGWDDFNTQVLDAYAAHDTIRAALDEIRETPPSSDAFMRKLRSLKAMVTTHFRADQKALFPKLRLRFGKRVMVELASELQSESEAAAEKKRAGSRRLWIRPAAGSLLSVGS